MPNDELSYKIGTRVARQIFELRGNNSETHINEAQLSAVIIASIELYLEVAPLNTSAFARAGGHARAHAMTPAQRTEVAKKAATARWSKAPKEKHGL
jgi:hypothetical protein